jgi:hypothetical protein
MVLQKHYRANSTLVSIISVRPSILRKGEFVVNGKVNGIEIQVHTKDDKEQSAKDALIKYYHSM